jgi:hypothetical protein
MLCNHKDLDMSDILAPLPFKDKQVVQLYLNSHPDGFRDFNNGWDAGLVHVSSKIRYLKEALIDVT